VGRLADPNTLAPFMEQPSATAVAGCLRKMYQTYATKLRM